MKSLARYAVANAVTRTMLSDLLKPEDLEAIARAGSMEEALTALARTSYGDYIPEGIKADELAVEKALREVTAQRFKRAIRHLKGSPGEVGKMLLSRWEVDNLEFALRLWHGKDTSLDEYISYPSFVHDLPVYEITAAETIDEIALALRHTPYIEPVVSSSRVYKTRGSIFYVEVALEADYYSRLLGAIAALGGADRVDGEKLIAAEIDLVNLSWLARLVQYYNMRDTEVHEFMIPGPSKISKRLSAPGHAGDTLKDISSELLQGTTPGGGGAALSLERLSLLEHVVGEASITTARAMMAGYPFRITSTLAFYILIRIELKNLFTIFVGKASGMTENEIMERLYGLG